MAVCCGSHLEHRQCRGADWEGAKLWDELLQLDVNLAAEAAS